MIKFIINMGVVAILSIIVFGCATTTTTPKSIEKDNQQKVFGNERLKKIVNDNPATKKMHNEGSLWNYDGMLNELFVTPKARNAGDIVTIKIVESASASNNAKTNTGRKSSLTASIDNMLGLEDKYTNSSNPDFKAYPNFNPFGTIEGGMSSKFDGSGATKRSGDLTAYITARVANVLPNGNFYITGSREITVNYEKQLILLTGVIRPTDIDVNNVILSTYISDAQIIYSGTGIIQKRQRPGWLANIINVVWPF